MGCNCGGSNQRPRPPEPQPELTEEQLQAVKGDSAPTPSAPPATAGGN